MAETLLNPCRVCGAPARVEFMGGIRGNIWACSQSIMFGGTCTCDVYLTADAWNAAPNNLALVERVFRHGFSGGWTANQTGRLAAPAAVDEAWYFYVADGALQKSVEATAPTPATDEREAAFHKSWCAVIDLLDRDYITPAKLREALATHVAAESLAAETRATALLRYAVHDEDCDGRLGPQYHCRCGLRALQHPSTGAGA